MSRTTKIRQWTLIHALLICLAAFAISPGAARATGQVTFGDPGQTGDGTGGGGGASGIGDPDCPDGLQKAKRSQMGRGGMAAGSRSVGDGSVSSSALMTRLYVAWVGIRGYWLHF